jgi:uncharacterized protein involved in response to NO
MRLLQAELARRLFAWSAGNYTITLADLGGCLRVIWSLLSLTITEKDSPMNLTPLFGLAFRPFFLGGAIFSVLAIGWWSWFWLAPQPWMPYGGPIWWHGHEMIFGFSAAIVVGFLLTAVQNWTGVPGIRGVPLLLLWLSWLTGRLVLALGSSLPSTVIVVADIMFLLFAAMAMAYPVFKVRQWRNIMFVPILLALALLNSLSHWGVLSQQPALTTKALHGAIMLVMLIVAIIGGRVMPMFTANGAGIEKPLPIAWLEKASLLSLLAIVVFTFTGFDLLPRPLVIALLAVSALFNTWRFLRWKFWRCWHVPLLWSLHLAYAFLPLGLMALAAYHLELINNISIPMHYFTVGGMGGMILAMITRVSLGHTGRPLQPPKPMAIAFALILLAAAVRVGLPTLIPQHFNTAIALAGLGWVLAYALFVICFTPILMQPRPDEKPG